MKRTFVALAFLGFGSISLRAATIEEYTGNAFNFFVGPGFALTTSDSVSAELIFSGPLAGNLNNADESGQLIGWTVTDGVHTLGSALNEGDLLTSAVFSTNGAGDITSWLVFACSATAGSCNSNVEIETTSGSGFEGFIGSYTNGFDESSTCCNNAAFSVNAEGTWTATQVTPEPGTFSSLLIVAGVILGRFFSSRNRGRAQM